MIFSGRKSNKKWPKWRKQSPTARPPRNPTLTKASEQFLAYSKAGSPEGREVDGLADLLELFGLLGGGLDLRVSECSNIVF